MDGNLNVLSNPIFRRPTLINETTTRPSPVYCLAVLASDRLWHTTRFGVRYRTVRLNPFNDFRLSVARLLAHVIVELCIMAAVLDDVGKSKVSKTTTEDEVFEDEQEDAEDGPAVNKKRRKRRKKKAQTNGEYVAPNVSYQTFWVRAFCLRLFTNFWRVLVLADEANANEKDEAEEEVANGVTNINMDDQVEGDKKKARRRGKKKETKEPEQEKEKSKEPESKEKVQTNPPSVPIHELFPTSKYAFSYLKLKYF